jgi:hypothetical protein
MYPCLDCEKRADKCTACFYEGYIHKGNTQPDKLWNLFQDKCVPECPSEYVSMTQEIVIRETQETGVHGFCYACDYPCKTCSMRPENCLLCHPSHPLLYQERCLDTCPRGSVAKTAVDPTAPAPTG